MIYKLGQYVTRLDSSNQLDYITEHLFFSILENGMCAYIKDPIKVTIFNDEGIECWDGTKISFGDEAVLSEGVIRIIGKWPEVGALLVQYEYLLGVPANLKLARSGAIFFTSPYFFFRHQSVYTDQDLEDILSKLLKAKIKEITGS